MDNLSVPLTLEGSYMLHQMMRLRWADWKRLEETRRNAIAAEAAEILRGMESSRSALFSLLGHKGDLLWIHFRRDIADLNRAELALAQTALWDYLEPTHSYLSVVELGLYESTQRVYRVFSERGLKPGTPEWDQALEEEMTRQRQAMDPRLHPALPSHRYVCFYPMDRRRGEDKNWYQVPFTDRARMMQEHGLIGRKYADHIKQIISGSMGFDDWEWGVDLFSEDPLWFKKIIYEMRFDEVSAVYALFGGFYVGIRRSPDQLASLLAGELA